VFNRQSGRLITRYVSHTKQVCDHHTLQFLRHDSAFKTGVNALSNVVFNYMELNTQ
jgi:hypothetical protein